MRMTKFPRLLSVPLHVSNYNRLTLFVESDVCLVCVWQCITRAVFAFIIGSFLSSKMFELLLIFDIKRDFLPVTNTKKGYERRPETCLQKVTRKVALNKCPPPQSVPRLQLLLTQAFLLMIVGLCIYLDYFVHTSIR